mmetsp:Transcript_10/g.8  ORF Transcript_10/g.8 Transcript_10/m.8 type:complete len:334 (-) Transcript_10:348-1349(-)
MILAYSFVNKTMMFLPIGIIVIINISTMTQSFQMTHTTSITRRDGPNTWIDSCCHHKHISCRHRHTSDGTASPSKALHAFDSNTEPNELLTQLDTFFKTAPYTAAFLTCGIKASAADFLAQLRSIHQNEIENNDYQKTEAQETTNQQELKNYVFSYNVNNVSNNTSASTKLRSTTTSFIDMNPNNNPKVELKRNLAFVLYGGMYQGMAQQYIFNSLFPQWFGTGNDIYTVLTKVIFNLVIISPLICLPIAYIVNAMVYGQGLLQGFEKYIYDLKYSNLLISYYSIWFPVGLATFGVIPEHLRIAFISFISFFWLIILSTISSSSLPSIRTEDK